MFSVCTCVCVLGHLRIYMYMYLCVCGLVYDSHVNASHAHTYTRKCLHAYIVYRISITNVHVSVCI